MPILDPGEYNTDEMPPEQGKPPAGQGEPETPLVVGSGVDVGQALGLSPADEQLLFSFLAQASPEQRAAYLRDFALYIPPEERVAPAELDGVLREIEEGFDSQSGPAPTRMKEVIQVFKGKGSELIPATDFYRLWGDDWGYSETGLALRRAAHNVLWAFNERKLKRRGYQLRRLFFEHDNFYAICKDVPEAVATT
jgi:hypothetical protein